MAMNPGQYDAWYDSPRGRWIGNTEYRLRSDGVAFVTLPGGIGFIFSRYEVGSYAEGDYRVVVPYSRLASVIRTDGPLVNAAKSP